MNDFLNIAAGRSPHWQTFVLGDLVEDVCAALGRQLEENLIDVDIDVPPNTLMTADREMIRLLLLDLVMQATRAMSTGGSLVVTSYECRDGLELEVADSGPGLSEEALKHIFEPSFDEEARGERDGLAAVHQIVAAHGGTVSASNCSEGGAAFTIKIPRRALDAAA